MKQAPLNNKLTSPDIQKDIAHFCAKETIGKILEELGDGYFAVLVHESRDVSCKQQKCLLSCDMLIEWVLSWSVCLILFMSLILPLYH